jgi:dienelactone hydrolase
MTTRVMNITLLLILLLVVVPLVGAQGPQPEHIELEASDGLVLVGSYYTPSEPPDSGAPAVLLLHQFGSRKEAWIDIVPGLLDAGYGVLAIDIRAHGETGGDYDWPRAEDDMQLWLDWLREQPGIDPERLNIVGASIGANLALRGMAADPQVVTAVALSPGLDYENLTTEDAMVTIGERPVFLVAAQRDTESVTAVKALASLAEGDTLVRIYPHGAHGTGIFMVEDDLAPLIVTWLDIQN